MLGDLFKIFIEEPQKLTKVGLRIIKTLFLLIMAEWLYRHFFGSYTLMKLSEYHDWVNFILSGRILIVIACYLIAKYFIEPLPEIILYFVVVKFLSKGKFSKIKIKDLKNLLNFFDIVRINNDSDVPKPGKNIEILYDIAKSFKDEEEIKGYNELKDSLLNNILSLYSFFIFLYFIFFEKSFHSNTFIFLILFGFCSLIWTYIFINSFIELMQRDHISLINEIDAIKIHDLVYELLERHGIKPYKGQRNIWKIDFFEVRSKAYALFIDSGLSDFYLNNLSSYINKLIALDKHLFIITKKNNLATYPELKALEKSITLISFKDYEDLKQQLTNKFLKKILER